MDNTRHYNSGTTLTRMVCSNCNLRKSCKKRKRSITAHIREHCSDFVVDRDRVYSYGDGMARNPKAMSLLKAIDELEAIIK